MKYPSSNELIDKYSVARVLSPRSGVILDFLMKGARLNDQDARDQVKRYR